MGLATEVIIAGIWAPGLAEKEAQANNINIVRIKTFADRFRNNIVVKVAATILFNVYAFLRFKKQKVNYINCHSLWVLPLCVALKKATGAKLIYDAHELETEREGLRGMQQKFAKYLERKLIGHIDKMIVVGHFIAEWYKNSYGMQQVYVVRNIPLKQNRIQVKTCLLKDKFQIPYNDVLFIYQGVLSVARGINLLLDVFANSSPSKHIVFMGYGPSEGVIKAFAKRHANIHFQTAVPLSEIMSYSSSADIGIFFIEKKPSLSYEYSLPNKFFEYIYSGIPMLISNFPEMKQLIDEFNCGWQVNSSATSLAEFINTVSAEMIKDKTPDIERFSNALHWEKEAEQFREIYV